MSALAVATGPEERQQDDLELVAAVRAGDDRAFEVLFRRYQPRITAYVGGMVRDHGRAEDITQEVFIAALRRLRTDDEREILFRPWIYEIAKNKCIDAYRRGRNAPELSFDAHDQIGAAEHGRLTEPGATPDAAFEGKLAVDNLRGAFGGLSPVHHEILVMREFEGLSYREIGERLGMSRPAVESTLFRARKRLGEEYEELVSGKRCLRVQRIVDADGIRTSGLREQRRVARHLAHCQPCRRHAFLAGVDLDLARPASVAARVAALVPLPALLRRRWGGGEEAAAQLLGRQATRPVAQWSAQVAGAVDPGTVSGWAKVAATAATVALAGVGGAAIEHRARPALAPPAAATAAVQPAGTAPRTAQTRRVAAGLPLPASAAAGATGAGGPAPPGERATAGQPGGTGAPAPGGERSQPGAGVLGSDPQLPLGGTGPPPQVPLEGAAGGPLSPVLDALADPADRLGLPARESSDSTARAGSKPGSRVADKAKGLTTTAGDVLPKIGSQDGRSLRQHKPTGDAPVPGRSGDGPGRGRLQDKNAPAVGQRPAHAAEVQAKAPQEPVRGLVPRGVETLANPTGAVSSLGG